MSDPYGAAGVPNPFPSKAVNHNVNFADAGFLPFGGGNPFFIDPNLRTPYIYQYNLTVQQQLVSNLTLEAGYVGNSAHGLTGLTDMNPFPKGGDTRLWDLNPKFAGQYNFMSQFQNLGHSNYNGLQLDLTKRISDSRFGLTFFTISYTWAHQIDNESGYRQRNNFVPFYHHGQFRASGDQDIRNYISLSGGWELPFHKIWEKAPSLLTKGWSLYPVISWRSGFPLDVLAFPGTGGSMTSPGASGYGDPQVVRSDLIAPIQYYDANAAGHARCRKPDGQLLVQPQQFLERA